MELQALRDPRGYKVIQVPRVHKVYRVSKVYKDLQELMVHLLVTLMVATLLVFPSSELLTEGVHEPDNSTSW